jgi:hypothetical protein
MAEAESKKLEGDQLVARAFEQSDIRAMSAPAFRMKASFRVWGIGSAEQGTYAETWVSREQWRRETEIGSFRRVEVAGTKKRWLLDSGKPVPPGAAMIAGALNLGSVPKQLKVKEIVEKNLSGVAARCDGRRFHSFLLLCL